MTKNSQVNTQSNKEKSQSIFLNKWSSVFWEFQYLGSINYLSILTIWRISRTLTVLAPARGYSQMIWWKQLSLGLSWERKAKSCNTSAAENKFIWITSLIKWQLAVPQIIAHIKVPWSSSGRWLSTSRGDHLIQTFYSPTVAKMLLLWKNKEKKKKRFSWAEKKRSVENVPSVW